MKSRAPIASCAALGLLSGCFLEPPPPPVTPDQGLTLSGAGGYGNVKEFDLKDGTHCVGIIGNAKAALSCDWKK